MNGENKKSLGARIVGGIFTGLLAAIMAVFVFVVMYY